MHQLPGDRASHRRAGRHGQKQTEPCPRSAGGPAQRYHGSCGASHAELQNGQRRTWADFYQLLHEQPIPGTYRDLLAGDVDVRDPASQWHGIQAWSAEERDAISLGVTARVVDVLASTGITVVELDFTNPHDWPDHCPPHATFVHQTTDGRSNRVRIHYLDPAQPPGL